MGTPILVTGQELYEKWMSDEATGMTDDRQQRLRIVRMADGTEYAATFDAVDEQQGESS